MRIREVMDPTAGFIYADSTIQEAAEIMKELGQSPLPVCEGQRGNPVLLDKNLFAELNELRGDTGGRELLVKYAEAIVAVPANRAVLMDIDTPEEYEKQNSGVRSQESE